MEDNGMHLDGDTLGDYAEGVLAAAAREKAEAHLQACAECRRELAAVRGYFQAMSDLDPVRAPADFLAKVRARLPPPSPWKAAWRAFARPWRAIPLQIALAAILGVTAITAYLHQRGGLEEAPGMLAPAVPAARPQLQAPAPEAASAAKEDRADLPVEAKAKSPQAEAEAPGAAPRKDVARKPASLSATSLDESGGYAAATAPISRPQPAPTSANTAAADKALDASGATARDQGAPVAANPARAKVAVSGAAAEKKRSAAVDRMAKAESEMKGEADEVGREDGFQGARSVGALGSADRNEVDLPGFTLSLKTALDTAALISGLRAMGAVVEARKEGAGQSYALRIPTSMLADLPAYLERYGKVSKWGTFPSAADGRARLDLRLILP